MKERNPRSVRAVLKQDAAALKNMTGKERIAFVWGYYRWYILAAVFAVFVVISTVRIVWEGQRPCRLRVCVVLNDPEVSTSAWFRDFEQKLKSDGLPGDLDVNEDQPFDYDNVYYQVMEAEVMTTISSQRMDVAICNEDLFSYLLALNACTPMDQVLPEYADAFELGRAGVQMRKDGTLDLESGTDGYYALNLRGTEFERTYNAQTGEPLYAVLISNTEHTDDALFLLRELMR